MRTLKRCDLCSSNSFEFLFQNEDAMFPIPGKYSLNKCRNCGLIFISPQPQKKELSKHYPRGEYYSSKETKIFKRYLGIYKNFYSNKGNLLMKILLYPFSLTVRSTKIIENGKLLDIGCGSGDFLVYMKKLGMDVYGVEPESFNDKSIKENELKISKKELKETNYPDNFFDVITMSHVFEHVNNPTDTLREIKRILKRGGTLILSVPNTASIAYKIFGKNWVQLDVPRHLFDYNPDIIKKYAKKVGLKFDRIKYNSSYVQFMVSILRLTNKYRKKKLYLLDKIPFWIKIFLPLYLSIALIFNVLRVGDQFEVFLKKD